MKSINKTKFFLLIWLLHIFIYYTTYTIHLRILENNYEEFYTVFGGFIGGLTGWFEQVPFFLTIPIFIMFILVNTLFKKEWIKAYLTAVSSTYLLNYLWLFFEDKHRGILLSTTNINLIYIIVPSLLITVLTNWLIFKRKYKIINLS